eukprot:1089925-Pleurochrysis_carterae.AAC.1
MENDHTQVVVDLIDTYNFDSELNRGHIFNCLLQVASPKVLDFFASWRKGIAGPADTNYNKRLVAHLRDVTADRIHPL